MISPAPSPAPRPTLHGQPSSHRPHAAVARTGLPALVAMATVLLLLVGAMPATAQGEDVAAGGGWVTGYETLAQAQAAAVATGGELLSGINAVRTTEAPTTFAATAGVRYAEPSVRYEVFAEPDDPEYRGQWAWPQAQLDTAWDLAEQDGDGVVVAVIDTGYTSHPDLEGQTLPGLSVVGTDTTDQNFHGTAVAGVVAALVDNDLDVAGACPQCTVLSIRVAHDDGAIWSHEVADAVLAAADAGADVINMSLGGGEHTDHMAEAIDDAVAAGAIVVAAAGNLKSDVPAYPAALPNVVSVAALDEAGHLDDRYSNFGETVDLAAGGCMPVLNPDGGTNGGCGTSYASPIVAGAIGLLLAEGVADPVAALTETMASVPDHDFGAIRVQDALRFALDLPAEEPTPTDPEPEEPAPSEDPEPSPAVAMQDVVIDTSRGATVVGFAIDDPGFAASRGDAEVTVTVGARSVTTTLDEAAAAAVHWGIDSSFAVAVPVTVAGALDVTISVDGQATAVDDIVPAHSPPPGQDLTTMSLDVSAATTTPGVTDTVLIASDTTFADALAASPLAADGPVLYTRAGADAPADDRVLAEVDRLLGDGGPCTDRRVLLLGGVNAIGAATESAIQDAGHCTIRIAGPSRVETAVAAAEMTAEVHGAETVLLARADSWADAAAAGAYAAANDLPVVLTAVDSLHPATAAWLTARQPQEIVLLGGVAALSPAVEAAVSTLAPTVTRVAGADRTTTSTQIATVLWGTTAPSGVILVDGYAQDGWAAALAASHPAAVSGVPVLYSPLDRVIPEVQAIADLAGWQWRITTPAG